MIVVSCVEEPGSLTLCILGRVLQVWSCSVAETKFGTWWFFLLSSFGPTHSSLMCSQFRWWSCGWLHSVNWRAARRSSFGSFFFLFSFLFFDYHQMMIVVCMFHMRGAFPFLSSSLRLPWSDLGFCKWFLLIIMYVCMTHIFSIWFAPHRMLSMN